MKVKVYLMRRKVHSVTFGGIDTKVDFITLTKNAWKELGEPKELTITIEAS